MEFQTNFTHIVVGAGSAGCVLAARVAENPDFNVLLLEAGLDNEDSHIRDGIQDIRRVPMKGQSETFDSRIDWNIRVKLPDGGGMNVPQAKVVGGGSSVNGGTALRNTLADCREWLELGNDAWSWDCVEPAYRELEDRHPLVRTKIEEAGEIQRAFVAGALDSGFSWTKDLNAIEAEGVGASPVCREGSRRISAANRFIDPIRRESNFTIATDTLIDRVVFSGSRATGVILIDGRQISASDEVILSAGPIFSPAVLQRSGIGPSALLSSLSIPIIQELPVGANLADHPCIPVVARPKPNAYGETDFSLQMQARWSSAIHRGAIDLQMICFSYLYAAQPPLPSPELPKSPLESQRSLGGTACGHVAGIGCNVNKPTSRGSLQIRSRNPQEQPSIAPNYLVTECDRACAREAVRLADRIIRSRALQAVLGPPLGPTCETIASDSLLDDWINSQYSSTYHFLGTCRMAPRGYGGVVDQNGCVYGVQGLRVVDASIIPTIPAANTMWTTMMFAERIGQCVRDGKSLGSDRQDG